MTTTTPPLRKSLGALQCFTLGYGAIVGVGWLIVLGSWLDQAGPVGSIIAFVAGGLLMLSVGLCYAEMATTLPASGGEVTYAYEVFGVRACFAIGWLLALVYVTVTAFEGISAAWLIGTLIPAAQGPVLYTVLGAPVRLGTLIIGIGGTAFLGYLNLRGIAAAARFQDLFTAGKIAFSLVFIGAGLLFGEVANLTPLFRVTESHTWWEGVLAVFVTTAFWYTGFNMVPQAMEEVAPGTPVRKVGYAMIGAIGTAIAFYSLVILATSMAAPWPDLAARELPVAAAFELAFGSPLLTKLVLVAALLGILTVWNPLILSGSRLLFALGRARIIDPRFAAVSARSGAPRTAVVFVAITASAAILMGRSALLPIVNVGSIAMAVAFMTTCLAVVRLRMTRPDLPRPYRVPGGIATALLGAASAGFMLVFALYQPYADARGRFPVEWAVLAGWLLLGVVFWVVARRVRATVSEADRRNLIVGTGGRAPS